MSHPDFAAVEACVFDAYGTLFNVHSAIARGGEKLGAKADDVSNTWRQKQLEYTWLRSLMGAHADFRQVTRDGLDYALAFHGVDDRALAARLMDLYLTLDAYPDAAPCLEALRAAGRATAILSNGEPEMLNAALTSAGLTTLFDAVLSVEDAGVYKPEPRTYQLAVDRLGVPAERIREERFAADAPAVARTGRVHAVALTRSGVTLRVDEGETVLAAAEAAGIQLPSGCRRGLCKACACTKRAGSSVAADVAHDGPGRITPCNTYPRSALELVA